MMPVLRRRRGQMARAKTFHVAAPTGGDDTVSPGTQIPPGRSIFSYNLIGAEYGLRTRLGYREWVTGLDGDPRSILPFSGSTKDGAGSRLFACTETGIWDCSSSTATPTQVVTFGTQNTDSGWGVSCAFTDLNGNHWLIYCDEANGYFTYAEQGSTWTQVAQGSGGTQINGVNPANFVSVTPWKNRLWFVEKDTQRAWYLGLGALYGTAAAFTFGSRFKAGGDLRTLASWTFDGGSGIDDRLVAVSGGGDVLIYTGTDPASASTFALTGVWFVGAVPVGRRLCTDFGGDLLLMSSIGILPLSRLVTGNIIYDRSQYQTNTIENLFNQYQAATASLRGWAMRLHPQDASLIVLIPQAPDTPSQQLAMSLVTKGWHRYRGMPMGVCAEAWNGTLYFGSGDGSGRVLVNDGYLDGISLADPNAFTPIPWSLLTAYSNLGTPDLKRIQSIRVKVMSQGGAIPVNCQARWNLDLSECPPPSAAAASPGGAIWDTSLWDQALWAGQYQVQNQLFGAIGIGQEMALAIAGNATSRMTLIGADVAFDAGSFL